MLKFLTHKLRTHSINEDNVVEKVEERDSGTESDDEAERDGDSCSEDVIMKWNDVTDIKSCGSECACATPRPDPELLYDHHSSEEELEVINGVLSGARGRRRGASSPPAAAPGKRRWPARDDDDDDKVETPVRFRTSPPREALKPRRQTAGRACECSPPDPRRRRPAPAPQPEPARPAPPARRHRPALDFDKMQQLKVGGAGVRSWRGAGAAGELSVYCW